MEKYSLHNEGKRKSAKKSRHLQTTNLGFIHQVRKDEPEDFSTLVQILDPHSLIVQVGIVASLATWQISRGGRKLLF